MHLHNERFVFLLALFGVPAVLEHEGGRDQVAGAGEHRQRVAPAHIVVVGVE